jgi:putative tryptophan/tyrosine transport system substrate-binding protein
MAFCIGRREFITLIGGAAAAWPFEVGAQQPTLPIIGFLSSRSPRESTYVVAAFRRGLDETGFVEGRNCQIAFRWAEGEYDQLPALAAELVSLPVTVLFAAGGSISASVAKSVTTTIPIVFSATFDPVRLGLVASLNRPGGNMTGMGAFTAALAGKRLELLRELIPNAGVMAYLVNPSATSGEIESTEALAAARSLGIDLHILKANTRDGLNEAFAGLSALRARALAISAEPFFDSQRNTLVALSARHAIPAIYGWREYVLAGGLLSYGTSLTDSYRQAGIYVGRILKGEKPAELPIVQPTKFELALNIKTAKMLGLTPPPSLLARADEVIE